MVAAVTPARALPALLMTLTFTTGLVDALSILGMGQVFTALMTGNVVFVGLSLADAPGFSASRSLWALGAFSIGAALGGRLARAYSVGPLRRWLLAAAAVEAGFMFASAAALWMLTTTTTEEATGGALCLVVALTAAAMGLRSATVVPLADPDLKTTVLTLTITALAADSPFARGVGARWQRRVLSVLMLGAGALTGAVVLRAWGLAASLVLMGVMVLVATAVFALHPSSAGALSSRAI